MEDKMSDEIKKPEVNAEEEKQLDEKALDKVVGGDAAKTKNTNVLSQGCAAGVHYTNATLY
jgi:hypothetical protein